MFGQKNKVDCLNDLPSENIAEIDAQKITDISVVRTIASWLCKIYKNKFANNFLIAKIMHCKSVVFNNLNE